MATDPGPIAPHHRLSRRTFLEHSGMGVGVTALVAGASTLAGTWIDK